MTDNPENNEPEEEAKEPEKASDPVERCEQLEKELLYLRAEFENFKRRLNKEKEQAIQFSNERFIHDILPVYNDFERALVHGDELGKERQHVELISFIDGVKMTYRELTQRLNKMGVEFVGHEGEVFDPLRHEALSQMEVTEDKVGTVVQVVQKGCLFSGRLINPAKVIVGKMAEGQKDPKTN